jgi:hypothetical protein
MRIETHLAGCPPCIEFAESLRKTVELCRHYQPNDLPEPLGESARQQLLDAYQRMLGARKNASSLSDSRRQAPLDHDDLHGVVNN